MPSRKERGNRIDELPTQSFADIAFLLIIFFILTMSMAKTMGFLTEMPAGQKSEEEPEKTTTVQLHEGVIRIDDDAVSLTKLRGILSDMNFAKKKGKDKIVLFEATGDCFYKEYYQVMAAITDAGAELVIVRAEGEDDAGGGGGGE